MQWTGSLPQTIFDINVRPFIHPRDLGLKKTLFDKDDIPMPWTFSMWP
jgi:hypothetical protein